MNQSFNHALGLTDHTIILCFAFIVYGVVRDAGVGPLSELVDVADVGGGLLEYCICLREEVTWERGERGFSKDNRVRGEENYSHVRYFSSSIVSWFISLSLSLPYSLSGR